MSDELISETPNVEKTKQKGKKFVIALVIIGILLISLIAFVSQDWIKSYTQEKQVAILKEMINAMMARANTEGYIIIQNETAQMVLIKYIEPQNATG